MFWFGLTLGLLIGAFIFNAQLRSVVLGKAKIKVVPNKEEGVRQQEENRSHQ